MDLLLDVFHYLLVVPMTNVLVAIANLFGGNFGIAIIIFTLVMKLVTWPLTASQYKTSRAMQAIQPKLQELQKRYKGKDPKKLQQETMALYREHGVNPFGCLLPMLAQFPIWIALYQVVRVTLSETPEGLVSLSQTLYPIPYVHSAIPLNNQFLLWNLGQTDTTYLLPLIVGATMYVQQKMITPAPTTAPQTPQQLQQQQTQQMMTWMMPLMFAFISTTVPAGLSLYWGASNLAGIALQYFYAGRKVDWGGMLRFGPPQPAGASAVRGARPPAPERPKNVPATNDVNGSDERADDAPVRTDMDATSSQRERRKRHGRRRGKR